MRESGSSMHARPYISSRSAIWVRGEKEGRSRNAACGGDDGKTREGEAEEFRRIKNKNHTATVKNSAPSPTRVKMHCYITDVDRRVLTAFSFLMQFIISTAPAFQPV